MSKPCTCSISMYVQNLLTAHAFVVVWRLVCSFCHPSLTSYGVSYFLMPYSLWLTPFKGWALLDCRLFFLQPTLLPLPRSCPHFLPYHFAILVVMFFDLSLLDLFGPAAYSSLNDLIWSFGLCITLLVGSFVPFISFWASLAHQLSLALFSNSAFLWGLPMGLLLLSLRAPLGLFPSSRPICLFYGPMIHYSCHFNLMVFLSTLI